MLKTSQAGLFATLLAACLGLRFAAAQESDPAGSPSVGEPRSIEQLFLPGSLLQVKPIDDQTQPIVLRIVQSFPHGTLGFRYDLNYTGYEPGSFDLREFLVRTDGGSTADLPPIPVTVRSLLPPGQALPNELEQTAMPQWGGYRIALIAGVVLWFLVLSGLLFLGRGKSAQKSAATKQPSLAELLRPKIQKALDGELDARQYAELERMLMAMWQRRLGLSTSDPSTLVSRIRQHPESGPLMQSLERWMHDPAARESANLSQLLEPLAKISANEFEKQSLAESPGTAARTSEARLT